MDPFVKPAEAYTRDYNLYETYLHDTATHLAKTQQIPLSEARAFVERLVAPDGQHPIKAPMARFLHRNKVGDRQRRQLPLDQFWMMVRDQQQIFSPSQTAYLRPEQKKSILGVYIDGNLKKRSTAKAEQFAAERAGDERTRAIKNSAQTTYKIKNNALSGAHSSAFTILWNKTAHSTLTSGCRVGTSYGNANNERFLYGNRHYWSPLIVKQNLISIMNHADAAKIEATMSRYGLAYPTVEHVMGMVERSTNSYWRDPTHLGAIRQLVETFTPTERAAVLYMGDLYHLQKVNPEFVRQMLTDFSVRTEVPLEPDDATHWIKQMDGELISYISMLCPDYLLNPETQKYEAFKEVKRPEARGILAANGKRVLEVQERYAALIETFWTTDNLPSSINYLPNIMRRGVVTSDTDSTIFSVARWPIWYTGGDAITTESMAISATMIYLASKTVVNILARYSGNCGMSPNDVFKLQLKNEFYMPVFCLTSRAKHYFAYITMQEGTAKREMEFDVKGVALRNSNAPPEITKLAHALMKKLMQTVIAGEKVSLRSVLRRVALIENDIKQSVIRGEYNYLKRMTINVRDSYKAENGGNYVHYEMWEQVFAAKYGAAPDLPYRAIKVSLNINNKSQMRKWLEGMEDRAIAQNIEQFLAEKGKDKISTLLLPEANLLIGGVPKEVIPVIDVRTLLAQTMEAFYLVLESIGYYCRDRNTTRLLSDVEWLLDPTNPIEPIEL